MYYSVITVVVVHGDTQMIAQDDRDFFFRNFKAIVSFMLLAKVTYSVH